MEHRARIQLARVSLVLTALVFFGFGALFALRPDAIGTMGVVTESITARIEIRAYYGGLGLGLGIFFALAAARRGWHLPALVAQIGSLGGLAAGRVLGMSLEGSAPIAMVLFAAVELAGVGLGLVALMALLGGRRGGETNASEG